MNRKDIILKWYCNICDKETDFRYVSQDTMNEHFYSCLCGNVVELKELSTLENLIKLYEDNDVVPKE